VQTHETGYIRPSVARKLAQKPSKVYHPNLWAVVHAKPKPIATIEVTDGLQGNGDMVAWAELEYRQHRPVHNTALPFKHPQRRPPGKRQECKMPDCKLMHDEAHLDRFTHKCEAGFFCLERKDVLHCARFRHASFDDDPMDLLWQQEGWAAENARSVSCAPNLNSSRLTQSMPALSCIPRGGFRPAGGTQSMTEMTDLRKRTADYVVMVLYGIHHLWTNDEVFDFVRGLCPFKLAKAEVVPSDSVWKNAGKALVTCYNFSEAEQFMKIFNNRSLEGIRVGGGLMTVEYNEPIQREFDTYEGKKHQEIFGIKDLDPALPRYNKVVRRCGAYWQDAEGVIERMRAEGHKPNNNTYIALLFCYRDGRPPQPLKAMLTLDRMRREKIDISVTACNLIVDTWCRAANMQKAEEFVAKMEKGIKVKSKWDMFKENPEPLALPNDETYLILTDGWERLGVMEDVAVRQRGYKMDEPPPVSCTHRREPSIAGVFGVSAPAPSILTSNARRRSGYVPAHTGYFQQQKNFDNFGLFEPNKWRTRV
jgi:hypothetical protein